MLLLARKAGQSVVIDGNIRVTVERIRRQSGATQGRGSQGDPGGS